MFTRITGVPTTQNDGGQRPGSRRRSPFAVPVAMLLSAAIMLIGVPAVAIADEGVPAGETPTASPTDIATPAPEPTDAAASDPAEPAPTPEPAPDVADPATPTQSAPPSDTPAVVEPTPTPEPTAASDESVAPEPTQPAKVAKKAVAALVPPAVGPSAVINVKVRSLRTGGAGDDGVPQPLAGVTLELWSASSAATDSPGVKVSPAIGDPPDWTECVSDAAGDCSFTVPSTQDGGINRDRRFWIVQRSAPDGYYLNPTLVTGANITTGPNRFAATPYVWRTGAELRAGQTYDILPALSTMPTTSVIGAPISGTGATAGRWKTGGGIPVSQDNNQYQPTCQPGLKVAMLLDLSTSMTSNNNQGLNGVRTAAKNFVRALAQSDDQAEVGLFTFATTAPASNLATGRNWAPELITAGNRGTDAQFSNASLTDQTSFYGRINSYAVAGASTQYTNWDRGFWQLAKATDDFDVAIVITDGNPTVWSTNPAVQGDTTFQHVENAIFSANALKDRGTQVLAFGVGQGISGVEGHNLRAVSGTHKWEGGSVAGADYFQTDDWGQVSDQLAELAGSISCTVPITVHKVEKTGAVEEPGDGWTFTSTLSGDGALNQPGAQVTPLSGADHWDVAFAEPDDTADVAVAETAQDGWVFDSVACTDNGSPIDVEQSPNFTLAGLAVGDSIDCVVTNARLVITHDKTVVSTTQNPDGTWDIIYKVVVTNETEGSTGQYSLTDLPAFGTGITVQDASATGPGGAVVPGWNGTSGGDVLATGASIDFGSPQTYVITVTASVATAVTGTEAADCEQQEGENGTGFLNRSFLTVDGETTEADACSTPSLPTFEKTFVSAVQDADDDWDVTYTLTVSNPSTSIESYSLSDSPAFPSGVTYNSIAVTSVAPAPAPITASDDAPFADPFPIAADELLQPGATHVYTVVVNATVDPGAVSVDDLRCETEQQPGVGFLNLATLTTGSEVIVRDDCSDIPLVDVGIEKSYLLPDGATAVEGGMEFSYTLVVTNNGPDDATGVVVSDTLEDELELNGAITVTPAVLAPTVVGNQITLTGAGPFGPGAIATITVPVKMKAADPLSSVSVGPDDPAPEPPTVDMSDIPNEACVAITENDVDASNDCDDVDVPTKRINPNVYVRCVNDVPWLYYDIAVTPSVPEGPITVTFTSADGSQTDVRTIPFDAKTGRLLWPGATVDENGIGIGYPGYRPVTAADLDSPLRFEDLVLDPSLPSYAWRDQVNPATITFQINPSQSVLAVYPQALPACAVERLPEVQIEKTASVERVDVGDDFQYTLQVTSTGLGAASPVEVFDEIPSDLRVDGITTAPGPDIPYWDDCEVTGSDSDGYGGTLHCDLVGLLGVNFPTAPPITLDVHVSEATTATTISNTGEVCWQHDGDTAGEVLCDDDTVDVLVKQVVLTGQAVCVRDTPLFSYSVTPTNLTDAPQVLLIWWTPEAYAAHDPSLHDADAILADGASQVDVVATAGSYTPGDTIAGSQLWPGAAVDAAGNPIAWPGWTELPNGQWVLDPSAPFYDLRASAVVEIRVNPTTAAITSYPPATPNCDASPPTTPTALASTGMTEAWVVWPAMGAITLGALVMVVLWLRRRRTEEA
ncbi:prealbumin-like fold domain-containing protein [Leifsonia sp. Leaf264]|uniref:prealbumin-like fold domain-containing protein n=1 Tax=Leifsonia sp. Leaf264 TaxID=1736314 RepID=UPI0006FDFCD8|nr:DUF11 domain-containing protein [Leifsonia sp. Leaf264]KQO99388.1 hypothetical protein ASF30_05435 [Leifsonia sp. Leaf264]